MNTTKFFQLLLAAGLLITFSACDDDDDDVLDVGQILVEDQMIPQNSVFVQGLEISENGWLVIHPDNGSDAPDASTIISEPVELEDAGQYGAFFLEITDNATLTDGKKIWLMLHSDTGEEGTWEFENDNTLDPPFTTGGSIVTESIVISSPSVTVSNQSIGEDNMVTVDEVQSAVTGWMVIHAENDQGGPGAILGKTQVQSGVNDDVDVELIDDNYPAGTTLFAMLHVDVDPAGSFDFPGNDAPEIFGFGDDNVIVEPFTVQ